MHSGMPCSNNCIKMYIHSDLSVLPQQGLPKTQTKYFRWSDCGRWHTLSFSAFSWISRGLWELAVCLSAQCQREILLVTEKNGVGISSPFSFPIFPSFKDVTSRPPYHQTAVLRRQLQANSKLSGLAIQCIGLVFSILIFYSFLLVTVGTHFASTMIPTILSLGSVC